MATKSSIQWTGKTWNPITGCSRVSPGCQNCYAEAMAFRLMHMPHTADRYAGTVRKTKAGKIQFTGQVNTVPEVLNQPRTWKSPTLVFVNSMSDLFHENVPREFLMEIWKVIRETPWNTYQILTKRPERIAANLPDDWGYGYPNVWLGVSIENQDQMKRLWSSYIGDGIAFTDSFGDYERTNNKFFISFEPLIGPIDLHRRLIPDSGEWFGDIHDMVDWVIIGGESGRNYRECRVEWINRLIDQIQEMNGQDHTISIFVKQFGTHLAKEMGLKDKKGGDPSEWPEHLRIREFPIVDKQKTIIP